MLYQTNLCAFYINHPHILGYPACINAAESSIPQQERVRVGPGARSVVFVCSAPLVSLSWKLIPGDPLDLSHRRSFSVFHPIPKDTMIKWGTVGNGETDQRCESRVRLWVNVELILCWIAYAIISIYCAWFDETCSVYVWLQKMFEL